MAKWLEELNPAQREAVTHGEGPLLVVAGAGTGKTRTLACRVAYLMQQGVPPERICLLTFTRRAAAEMIGRAEALTRSDSHGRAWGGTFHSVASRLLRLYGTAIGLHPNFSVYDQSDAADLMSLIVEEHKFTGQGRRFPRKHTLVAIYSRAVNAQDKLTDVLDRFYPWCREWVEAMRITFGEYTRKKREQNVLDYDDLLLMWKALCSAPEVGKAVAGRFDHLLVDEFQDTNAVQGDILRAMRRERKNIMAVGDDAQSIYAFRAATVRNMLDFPEHYPGARVITLEQNYRSVMPILTASNAIMEQARERFTKNLWSSRSSEEKPRIVMCRDDAEESRLVAERILQYQQRGIPLMKQAVLFRAGSHSARLEIELSRRNIPFHKYGGLKFVESAHIKDVLALLRILDNPTDELSWFRILVLLDGIGPVIARKIMKEIGLGGNETIGASLAPLITFVTKPVGKPSVRPQLDELKSLFADCRGWDLAKGVPAESDKASEPPLSVQLERIRDTYTPILENSYDNSAARIRDLGQLEHMAAGYRSRRSFVTDLTLDPPASTSDLAGEPHLDEDYVILSTIHSAKGCEWDVVFVIHAADGNIPSDMSLSEEDGLDEERRLFYVALTRARNHLQIFHPIRYYHTKSPMGDAHSYAQLTRFIDGDAKSLFDLETPPAGPPEDASGVAEVDREIGQLWQ